MGATFGFLLPITIEKKMDKPLFQTYQTYLNWERLASEWEALKNSSDSRLADLQEEAFEALNAPLEAPLGEKTSLMDAYLKEGSCEDPSTQLGALIAFGREQTEARLRSELNFHLEREIQDMRTARYFMEQTEGVSALTGEVLKSYPSLDYGYHREAVREVKEMQGELGNGNVLSTAQHYLFGRNRLAAAAVYADGEKAFKALEAQEKIKGLGIVIAAAAVAHAATGAAILAGAAPEAAATFLAPLGFTGTTRALHGRLWNPNFSTAENIGDWVLDYGMTASMFKYVGVATRGLAGEAAGPLSRYAAESAGFATYTPMENIARQAIAGQGFDEQLFLDQTASPQALLDQQLMLLGLKAGGYPMRLTMRPLDRAVWKTSRQRIWEKHLKTLEQSGEDISALVGLRLAPIAGSSGKPPVSGEALNGNGWTLLETEIPLNAGLPRKIVEDNHHTISLYIPGNGNLTQGSLKATVRVNGGESGEVQMTIGADGTIKFENAGLIPFKTGDKIHLSAQRILAGIQGWAKAYRPSAYFEKLFAGVRHSELKRLLEKQRELFEREEFFVEHWVTLLDDVFAQLYNPAEFAAEEIGSTENSRILEAYKELVGILREAEEHGVHFPRFARRRAQALALAAKAQLLGDSPVGPEAQPVPRDPASGMAEVRAPQFLERAVDWLAEGAKRLLGLKSTGPGSPSLDIMVLTRRLEAVSPDLAARRGIARGAVPPTEKIDEAGFLQVLEMELTDAANKIREEGAAFGSEPMDWSKVKEATRLRAWTVLDVVQTALQAGKDVRAGKPTRLEDDYQLVEECVRRFPAPIGGGSDTPPTYSINGVIQDPPSPPKLKLQAPPGASYSSLAMPDMSVITIGRDPGNLIPISDKEVSRWHAEIHLRKGSWMIKDLGSTNGTFVNDQPMHRTTPAKPLQAGDIIKISQFKWTVELENPPATEAASSPLIPAAAPARPLGPPDPGRVEGVAQSAKVLGDPPPGSSENPIIEHRAQGLGWASATSDPGNLPPKEGQSVANEDGALLVLDPFGAMHLAVFDGVSDTPLAGEAARKALETMEHLLEKGKDAESAFREAHLAIANVNAVVGKKNGGETVGLTAAVMSDRVQFFWAGDALGLVLRIGPDGAYQVIYQTFEDTAENDAVRRDEIPLHDDHIRVKQAKMSNAMGVVGKDRPEFVIHQTADGVVPDPQSEAGWRLAKEFEHGVRLEQGDLVILLTDGGSENIRTEDIPEVIRGAGAPPGVVGALREEVHLRMSIYAEARHRMKDWLERKEEPPRMRINYSGRVSRLRQYPDLFIDKEGYVWDRQYRGKPVDRFKCDHFSAAAHLHDSPASPAAALPEKAGKLSHPTAIVRFFMEEASRQDGEDPQAREFAWVVRYDETGRETSQFVVVGERDRVAPPHDENLFVVAHNHPVRADNRGASLAPAEMDLRNAAIRIIGFLDPVEGLAPLPNSHFHRDGKFYNYIFSEEGVCVMEIDPRPSSLKSMIYFSLRPGSTGDPQKTRAKIVKNMSKGSERPPEVFNKNVIEVPWGEITGHPAFAFLFETR